jgi:acetyltransferase-like isoleucine patch superfamily enzyme
VTTHGSDTASQLADIVVFGAGQIAEVAKVYIDRHGPDRIVGFTVDREYVKEDTFHDLPVVEWERLEARFPPDQVKLLGPLSFRRMNEFRRDRHQEGLSRGYSFTSFIHPDSYIYTDDIGTNCFILENNVIQPFVKIGTGVMMWSGNHIGHHVTIGDYCFLASHVGIAGASVIGERCYLAGKAGIEMGVTIGAGSYLGSATLTRKDLSEGSVVPAVGAKVAAFTADRIKRIV